MIDANVFLEVLYKRERWEEAKEFLVGVKEGAVRAFVPHFILHGVSALLGKPELVAKFLAEVSTWRGLSIVETTVQEEIAACQLAAEAGLDFDDGLVYYVARQLRVPVVSYDRDFDRTDVGRVEPAEASRRAEGGAR